MVRMLQVGCLIDYFRIEFECRLENVIEIKFSKAVHFKISSSLKSFDRLTKRA